ncbi:hypothetical protein RZS08_19660 [Arthrospira platensis SPKY1]|nr:hypothetical protein [Arthrospira platensis SPKY1]
MSGYQQGRLYSQRAKQALSDLAFNQQARVVVRDTDRFGRTIGRV